MPISIFLLGLWILAAWRTVRAPERVHWPVCWALIATGIPLLGLVTLQVGPVAGLLALVSGALLIRGPRPDVNLNPGGE